MVTPAPDLYEDINSSSPAPKLTSDHIKGYHSYFDKNVGSGKAMYDLQYLNYVKYCVQGKNVNYFFFLL